MAQLSWIDADGAGVLGNITQIPVNRFDNWVPDVNPIADSEVALGTGIIHTFEYRVDDLVSLEIPLQGPDKLALMLRLKKHLLRGGEVALTADNALAEFFSPSTLAPGTRPEISFADRQTMEYTFSVTLRTGGASGGDEEDEDEPGVIIRPGLIIDLDPDALTGIASDGDFTSYCPDTSGHGHQANQATEAKYAKFVEDVAGGYPVLEFQASSFSDADFLQTDDVVVPTTGTTWFTVCKRVGGGAEAGYIFGLTPSSGDPVDNPLYTYGGPGGGGLFWGGSGAIVLDAAYPDTGGDFVIHTVRFESTIIARHWLNDVEIGTVNPASSADSIRQVVLGRGAHCYIARVRGFNVALTNAQVAAEQDDLAGRFGITF